ncbi:MAG: hypothetical protein R2817_06390 [Flavobacteriales bacterium]
MNRSLAACILLGLQAGALAHADTVPSPRPPNSYKVLLNLDARRTFVDAIPVRFYGLRIGAQRGRDVLTVGFYGLGDPFQRTAVLLDGLGVRDVRTQFDFVAFGYERILLDSKRWEIGIPVTIGLGNYRTSYRDSSASVWRPYSSNELVPVESGVQVDYKLFWWAFVGVGGGYRYVLAEDPIVTTALSDFNYYFKFGLRFGEIVKRTRRSLRKQHGTN